MQVADNQATIDVETAGNSAQEPERGDDGVEVGSPDDVSRASGQHGGHRFAAGNQLWRRRNKAPGLQTSRRALREAFHKALTPDKMAACVAKMLDIIDSSDKKAAVQAFKVLAECAGMRGESDSTRSGPSFTFILPGPGAIPDRPVLPEPITVKATESAGLLTAEPIES